MVVLSSLICGSTADKLSNFHNIIQLVSGTVQVQAQQMGFPIPYSGFRTTEFHVLKSPYVDT